MSIISSLHNDNGCLIEMRVKFISSETAISSNVQINNGWNVEETWSVVSLQIRDYKTEIKL